MIIRVHTKNFKSFESDTEICFIASRGEQNLAHHVYKTGALGLLRHSAIYGANAAGKTNIIRVFELIVASIQSGSVPLKYRESFCKSKLGNRKKESFFDIQFKYEDRVFEYGFSCNLFTRKITREYLHELLENKNAPRIIFERDKQGNIVRGKSLDISSENLTKTRIYEEDFRGNTDRLYLKEINTNKKLDKECDLHLFEMAYEYLSEKIITLNTNEGFISLGQLSSGENKKEIVELFQLFDTGVTELTWEKLDPAAWDEVLPKPKRERFLERIEEKNRNGAKSVASIIHNRKGFFLYEQKANEEHYKLQVLRFKHLSSPFSFSFDEESDGTRRLFEIVGVLLDSEPDRAYVIDEINRSLHPMLSKKFVELFVERKKDSCSQLIFSTHEPLLLEENTFRRDEIWFVERGDDNTSKIFPLDQFKNFAGRSNRVDYLDGRYGAIPRLRTSLRKH